MFHTDSHPGCCRRSSATRAERGDRAHLAQLLAGSRPSGWRLCVHLLAVLLAAARLISAATDTAADAPLRLAVEWVEQLDGDFAFRNQWSYPEGVYRNRFGQLGCDGICPEGVERMLDDSGRVLDDSLHAFYRRVDTTHLHHSIASDASAYEWAGTDFMHFERTSAQRIHGQSACNAATHSSLHIEIAESTFTARVELSSIAATGHTVFPLTRGELMVDRGMLARDTVKAVFDLRFYNPVDSAKPIYWRGRIYSVVDTR